MYFACHGKAAADQLRLRAPQLLMESLCMCLPLERQPRASGGHAPQLLMEALCTAPAAQKAAGPAAASRRSLVEALCAASAR